MDNNITGHNEVNSLSPLLRLISRTKVSNICTPRDTQEGLMLGQIAGAAACSGTSHLPGNVTFMDRPDSPIDDLSNTPLQNRMIIALRWTDAGDRLGIRLQSSQKNCYMLNKKSACLESAYLRSCYTSSNDRYPNTTKKLIHASEDDDDSWVFILLWLRNSQRIRSGLNPAEKQPEISIKEWCEQQGRITFLEWSQIYCLAEALHMPRLEAHIRVAIELKAIATKRLPMSDAIEYLYQHSSRFCTLKNVFVDMYAIAAMKPKNVFVEKSTLYPADFVRDVSTYCKSEAYVERREALKQCAPRPPRPDEYDEDDVYGDEESDDDEE